MCGDDCVLKQHVELPMSFNFFCMFYMQLQSYLAIYFSHQGMCLQAFSMSVLVSF